MKIDRFEFVRFVKIFLLHIFSYNIFLMSRMFCRNNF